MQFLYNFLDIVWLSLVKCLLFLCCRKELWILWFITKSNHSYPHFQGFPYPGTTPISGLHIIPGSAGTCRNIQDAHPISFNFHLFRMLFHITISSPHPSFFNASRLSWTLCICSLLTNKHLLSTQFELSSMLEYNGNCATFAHKELTDFSYVLSEQVICSWWWQWWWWKWWWLSHYYLRGTFLNLLNL